MVATSAKVAAVVVMVVVMMVAVAVAATTCGAPGRGAAWSAALGWGRTQGPPRTSLRHQRVAEADTRGALATKGTIFWSRIRLAGRPQGCFGDTAEPQLRHGVAVGGPSQKVGGLLRACSWKKMGESPYTSCPTPTPPRRGLWKGPSLSPIKTGKMGAGIGVGQKGGESRKYEALGRFWVEVKAGVTGQDWRMRCGPGGGVASGRRGVV